jgi:hypothetical protein
MRLKTAMCGCCEMLRNYRRNTMTVFPILKHSASQVLPEQLFQQMTPDLDALGGRIQADHALAGYIDYLNAKDRNGLYNSIRAEFRLEASTDWAAFARRRWPEIEQHFNLNLAPDDFDEIDF